MNAMRLKIEHVTRYSFEEPVISGLQQLRKTPKSTSQQSIVSWDTTIEHGRKELSFDDHHNNTVELVSFDRDATDMVVTCKGEVEIADTSGIVGRHRGPTPLWLYKWQTDLTQAKPPVRAFLRSLEITSDLDGMHKLMGTVRDKVAYEIGTSKPDWSAADVLEAGKGVCQDHTHVFLACAREMDMPARYVSGYLMLNETTVQEAMHAWAEVYIGDLGWVGFDVSNSISPDTRYVRVATGLDYAQASPVTGMRVGGAGEVLEVRIDIAQQ